MPDSIIRVIALLTITWTCLLSPVGVAMGLEEVIVTATKRERSLQDVSLAVSVLSGDQINNEQIATADALTRLTPSLNMQTGIGPADSSFNIRGIGTQGGSPAQESSISTMVDGVVLGSSAQAFMGLLDVQRVEVLRGPQGTLFGKNASGGVIHVVTKDPSDQFSGKVSATYLDRHETRLGFTVAGPLTDSLSGRIAASGIKDRGYATNVFDGRRTNLQDNWSVRAKLKWNVSNNLTFKWTSDFARIDARRGLSTRYLGANNGTALFTPLPVASRDQLLAEMAPVTPSEENDRINLDGEIYDDWQSWGHALNVDWQLGEHILSSISSYREFSNIRQPDLDARPVNVLSAVTGVPPTTHQHQYSQELRLVAPERSWGTYVAGLYYFNQVTDEKSSTDIFIFTHLQSSEVQFENIAAFGELTVNLAEGWRGVLGARYAKDYLDFNFEVVGGIPGLSRPIPYFENSTDEGDLSLKLAVEWDVAEDTLLYTTIAEGYKGPAFDIGAGTNPLTEVVAPETSLSFEVGLKTQLFDNRLTLNGAIFYTAYDNFQAQSLLDDGSGTGPSFHLVSAGEVSTRGIELDFIAQPSDNFWLTGGVAYIDGRIDKFKNGNCSEGQKVRLEGSCGTAPFSQDLSGGQLPYTPKWKLTTSANYRLTLKDLPFDAVITTSVRAQDSVLYEISQDPLTEQDAYAIVDLSASLVDKQQRYDVRFFVKNLFDQSYASLIFGQSEIFMSNGYVHAIAKLAKRTAGISFNLQW